MEQTPKPPHDASQSNASESDAFESDASGSVATYTVGLVFALLLTGASFLVSQTNLLWAPGVSAGLAVLAIAQMGVHLVLAARCGSWPT
jgi:cytochrome o ubiquinol oxidase operon protein cyoD